MLVMISYGFLCSVPAFYLLFNPNVFSICSNHKAIGGVFQGSVESSGESKKKLQDNTKSSIAETKKESEL